MAKYHYAIGIPLCNAISLKNYQYYTMMSTGSYHLFIYLISLITTIIHQIFDIRMPMFVYE